MNGQPVASRRTLGSVTLLIGLTLTACQAGDSPAATSSTAPSSAAAPSRAADPCPAIDLREPSGSIVDISGEWAGDWFNIPPSTGQRTFILQVGDCVWASILDDQFRAAPTESRSLLAQYVGRLNRDFSVTGNVVTLFRWVDPFTYGEQPELSPMNLLIKWDDDGAIRLEEDREPGIEGPRCPNPTMWCPAPTVLYPISDAPAPSPS